MQEINTSDVHYRFFQAKNKLSGYTVHFSHKSAIDVTIAAILQNMDVKVAFFKDTEFNSANLNENTDIVVNSDVNDWVNNDNCITINTWNYKYTRFADFEPFIENCDEYKDRMDYVLAVRAVCDMLYCVAGVLVF